MTGTDWRKPSRSNSGACVEAGSWRKSSLSFSNGNCVEVGQGEAVVAVRDSKDPDGAVLAFSRNAWQRFTATAKDISGARPDDPGRRGTRQDARGQDRTRLSVFPGSIRDDSPAIPSR